MPSSSAALSNEGVTESNLAKGRMHRCIHEQLLILPLERVVPLSLHLFGHGVALPVGIVLTACVFQKVIQEGVKKAMSATTHFGLQDRTIIPGWTNNARQTLFSGCDLSPRGGAMYVALSNAICI